jgi:hypothetical protein
MSDVWLSTEALRNLLGVTDRAIRKAVSAQKYTVREVTGERGGRGGVRYEIALSSIPKAAQTKYRLQHPPAAPALPPAEQASADAAVQSMAAEKAAKKPARKWGADPTAFDRLSEKQKQAAYLKLDVMLTAKRLTDSGEKKRKALELAAAHHGVSKGTAKNWWYGNGNKPGAQDYDPAAWSSVLMNHYDGTGGEAPIAPLAWDFYTTLWLQRHQPAHMDCYRRTLEEAVKKGWDLPSEVTIRRKVQAEIAVSTIVLLREGEKAWRKLHPFQHRDKTCFKAGEAVSGDGLKFDKIWVKFDDDEILNTATGWFWQDIFSGKLIAYRLGKTENTDLFRLATYDLTSICLPYYVQIDNTRVAANKAMTGGVQNRYRFGHDPDDVLGALPRLGMDVHFTNPDQSVSNPGAKPIERGFGKGGIHDAARNNPRILNRGFSRDTAITYAEFAAVVAEEVARHNARPKRQSAICGGALSFDAAWEQSFSSYAPRIASPQQRAVLLLMPEKVRANAANGMIILKAGKSPQGANRYHCEALQEFRGQELVAFYDPENFALALKLYRLSGEYLFDADRLDGVAFNDMDTAREHARNLQRKKKADKLAANATRRMSDLELQAMLGQAAEAPPVETPKTVTGRFKADYYHAPEAVGIDEETGDVVQIESSFARAAEMMDASIKKQQEEDL